MDGAIDTIPLTSVNLYSVGRMGVTIFVPHPQKHLWHAVLNRVEIYRTPASSWCGKDSM
jgi:hypothetical protein